MTTGRINQIAIDEKCSARERAFNREQLIASKLSSKQRESGRDSTYERRWITPLNAFQRTPRDMVKGKAKRREAKRQDLNLSTQAQPADRQPGEGYDHHLRTHWS